MNSKFVALSAVFTGVLVASPIVVAANTVVLPVYGVSQFYLTSAQGVPNSDQTVTTLGAISSSRSSPGGTIGTGSSQINGSVAGTPAPLVTASTKITLDSTTVPPADAGLDTLITSASEYIGELKYYVEVLGPTFTAPLAVTAKGGFNMKATGPGDAFNADLNLTVSEINRFGNPDYNVLVDHSYAFGSNSAVQSQSSDVTGTLTNGLVGSVDEQGTYTVFTNTVYLVDMTVIVSGQVNGMGGVVETNAYLDPFFTIPTGTPDAQDYSLVFSGGIGNTAPSAAPEPATWATMLLGFAMIGARTRRRRVPDPSAT